MENFKTKIGKKKKGVVFLGWTKSVADPTSK